LGNLSNCRDVSTICSSQSAAAARKARQSLDISLVFDVPVTLAIELQWVGFVAKFSKTDVYAILFR
jgi:hypothetical protein